MRKHYVTFFSPGTFVAETTVKEIKSWDVATARKMATKVTERYGATPYGFRFHTDERKGKEWEPKTIKRSGMYYLNAKVETLAEIEKRDDPTESILRSNMKINGWDKVVTSTKGYRWTQPLEAGDTVL